MDLVTTTQIDSKERETALLLEWKDALLEKYGVFNTLYKDVLDLLKKEHIIDNTADTTSYVNAAMKDMGTPLNTYYKTQVKEKYGEEVALYDSVFFLPVINRIFEMTQL